jgi:hypothetical protein
MQMMQGSGLRLHRRADHNPPQSPGSFVPDGISTTSSCVQPSKANEPMRTIEAGSDIVLNPSSNAKA